MAAELRKSSLIEAVGHDKRGKAQVHAFVGANCMTHDARSSREALTELWQQMQRANLDVRRRHM